MQKVQVENLNYMLLNLMWYRISDVHPTFQGLPHISQQGHMTNSDQLARVDETQVTSGQKTSRIGETWSSSLFPHSVDPRRFCVPDKASTRYWKLS